MSYPLWYCRYMVDYLNNTVGYATGAENLTSCSAFHRSKTVNLSTSCNYIILENALPKDKRTIHTVYDKPKTQEKTFKTQLQKEPGTLAAVIENTIKLIKKHNCW